VTATPCRNFAAGELDVPKLLAHKAADETVHRFKVGQPISHDEMIAIDCDVWIPAAQPDVLTAGTSTAV
jgi:glutamate dehydrogenase (NAD(P)+)